MEGLIFEGVKISDEKAEELGRQLQTFSDFDLGF